MLGITDGVSVRLREVSRVRNEPVETATGLSWDFPSLCRAANTGLSAAIAAAQAEGVDILGVGVDSWGVDYVRLTRDGEVRPFVRHHREGVLPERSDAERRAAYARTGVLDQPINTSNQLIQDERGGLGAPDDTALLIADAVVWALTGVVGADRSLASTTALVDLAGDRWLPTSALILPPLRPGGRLIGLTTPEVTAAVGAQRALSVWAVTAHDTAAAFSAVGSSAIPGGAVISCGSWSVVGVAVARPVLSERARALGFTQESGADGDTLLVKNLRGLRLLQDADRVWAQQDQRAPGDLSALQSVLAEARESAYQGRFDANDEALDRPGSVIDRLTAALRRAGAGAPASRGDLVRSIIDSLAHEYARTLAGVEEVTGQPITHVHIVGGGARNADLVAATARATGREVRVGAPEASALGMTLQMLVTTGRCADLEAARRLIVIDEDELARAGREGSGT